MFSTPRNDRQGAPRSTALCQVGQRPGLIKRLVRFFLSFTLVGALTSCGPDGTGPQAPSLSLSRTSVSFASTAGGSASGPEQIQIVNSGEGTLTGLSGIVSYGGGQPTGWLQVQQTSNTTPSTLILTAFPGMLTAGTYAATVSVTASGANNSPQSINVTLVLSPPVTGSLRVTTTTNGNSIDPTGYVVSVTAGTFGKTTDIGVNGCRDDFRAYAGKLHCHAERRCSELQR